MEKKSRGTFALLTALSLSLNVRTVLMIPVTCIPRMRKPPGRAKTILLAKPRNGQIVPV
eukprot:COSAG02_NODE_51051_length_316_cov_1.299539_2_plen_58_part_01